MWSNRDCVLFLLSRESAEKKERHALVFKRGEEIKQNGTERQKSEERRRGGRKVRGTVATEE